MASNFFLSEDLCLSQRSYGGTDEAPFLASMSTYLLMSDTGGSGKTLV